MPPCHHASQPAQTTNTHPHTPSLVARHRGELFLPTQVAQNRVSGPDPAQGDPMLEPRVTKFVDSYTFGSGCPKKRWLQESARQRSLEYTLLTRISTSPPLPFLPSPLPCMVREILTCSADDNKEEDTLQRHVCQFTGTPSEYGRIHSTCRCSTSADADTLGGERAR